MIHAEQPFSVTMPGSPPELSGSKSSKSSSYHSSYQSDDTTILTDVANFEDIGLDDDSKVEPDIRDFAVKTKPSPFDATYAVNLRTSTKDRQRVPMSATHGNRLQRELISGKLRLVNPSLHPQGKMSTDGLGLMPVPNATRRVFTSPPSPSSPITRRNRSASPNLSIEPNQMALRTRRSSWQTAKERKTAKELEKECDEDDGDDLPDECELQNVPLSPRPPSERTPSVPASASTSPERPARGKSKPLGNGTSPLPAEQGELRSPRLGIHRGASMGQFPINHNSFKGRAKSWTSALSDLSEEAKALTVALEEHDDESTEMRRSFGVGRTTTDKPRVRSAIAELPPLRRTNIMIDPLPVSKEKEAVLSRTRPSWLPPKDPAEEKRHLREYQKMMALSLEADRKREAAQRTKSTCRDDTAGSLLRIWEEHVLPNWDDVTRQKRTRELWWRGIAPRSRGQVWAKAIGNELGLSDASYTAALRRAQALEKTIKSGSQLSAEEQKKRAWIDAIERDVKQTYPDLKIFQPEGPLHGPLLDVLKAYAMYRSDVGYVHGTSTIAALLILNTSTSAAAFSALSNILNRPLPLSFHTCDSGATQRAYTLLLSTLQLKSPRLHAHLTSPTMSLSPDMFFRDYFTSLGTGSLSVDNATRLWDVMVFEGDAVLVRAGVAFLTSIEGKLFGAATPKEVLDIIRGGLSASVGDEQWMKCVRDAGKS